jgi:hypothetical protein
MDPWSFGPCNREIRMTKLGEFSPIGRVFLLGSFLITDVAHIFELLLSTVKVMHSFGPKTGWATFWAIFSQTHLVTLS